MQPRHATAAFALAIAAGLAYAAAPKPLGRVTGTCTKIVDGDTIYVAGIKPSIRLYGIDTPESKNSRWPTQPGSSEARQWLIKQILEKQVTVEIQKTSDVHSRYVGVIWCEGRNINLELLKAGHGWWYQAYAKKALDYQQAELEARSKQLGIWGDSKVVAPWDWRKGKR